MTNNTLNNALDTWQGKDMTLPDLNGKFVADISKLGINLDAESSLRFCQALLWADANLDGYKLIESHSEPSIGLDHNPPADRQNLVQANPRQSPRLLPRYQSAAQPMKSHGPVPGSIRCH
jgi:hypothetical protein